MLIICGVTKNSMELVSGRYVGTNKLQRKKRKYRVLRNVRTVWSGNILNEQRNSRTLRNSKIHNCVHKYPPLELTLRQKNPLRILF